MPHWTSESAEDFLFTIIFDAADSFWRAAEQAGIGVGDTHSNTFDVDYAALGKLVGESARRVHYFFAGGPKDLSVRRAYTWARALGHKLALVLYQTPEVEDTGPVMPCVFTACWIMCGRPKTMWDLEDVAKKLGVELPDEFRPHVVGE